MITLLRRFPSPSIKQNCLSSVYTIIMMKFIVSISLHFMLLFVFTTAPMGHVWACGKNKAAKEGVQHKPKCQKECCKKPCSNSKNKKKGCCGDDCQCAVSVLLLADLPKPFSFFNLSIQPVLIQKNAFFYKQVFSKSTIQDIWQPPITRLSV